ncbi:MAG: hypothetical protein K2H48_04050 [Duncaniella sp.]|nr:hypothetical protein [Duncaniella sp.]
MKYIAVSLFCIFAALLGLGVLYYSDSEPDEVEVRKSRVNKIETMTRLCTTEFFSEIPVLDTIHSKVIFAIQKQRGSVGFDIDNLKVDADGDTIKVTLSPEIVELYEATDDKSWEVIDTKAIGALAMLRSDKFTLEEENAVKARIRRKSMRHLYSEGVIERARTEGAQNLRSLLEKVYRKPVVVDDPTPKGAYYHQYLRK